MLSDPRGKGGDMVSSIFSRGKEAFRGKLLLDRIKGSLVAVQARINEADERRCGGGRRGDGEGEGDEREEQEGGKERRGGGQS